MQTREIGPVEPTQLQRLTPRILWSGCLGVIALLALSGCGSEEPQRTTQVIVQPPAQQQPSPSVAAPGPPPPVQNEVVPPAPSGSGSVVWRPGHWRYSGNQWLWQPGQYVSPPAGQTTWIPGRWAQQPGGGWVWVDGYWA
jgi:hypothetical protein